MLINLVNGLRNLYSRSVHVYLVSKTYRQSFIVSFLNYQLNCAVYLISRRKNLNYIPKHDLIAVFLFLFRKYIGFRKRLILHMCAL